MAMSGFDRWLTTDRAAEASEAEEEAFGRWAEQKGLDSEDSRARAEWEDWQASDPRNEPEYWTDREEHMT